MPFLIPIWASIELAVAGIGGTVFGMSATVLLHAGLRIAGSFLISAASRALMPKPNLLGGDRTVTVREPVRPRDIVYGRARKGGTIVFLHTTGAAPSYGAGNALLHLVVALSVGPIQSIGAVYFDGVLAINAAGVVQGRWAGLVTLKTQLGLASATGFPDLVGASGGLWTSDHRLRGVASVYLQLRYSSNAFPGGIPNISFDVKGKADILDPRTGTRGYSENPALCLADYMSLVPYGVGAAIGVEGGITNADLIEAANICDEAIPLTGGGTEPRYSLNGVVTLNASPRTVIEAMLSAMAGHSLNPDGSWRIRAGAYRTPSVTLTADDARGSMKLTTRASRAQNFNAVRGQFVSPENDWQPDDFPAWTSATYLAEDNGEQIWADITLPFTISSTMAQRLAKIHLERRRRQMTAQFPGKLSAWAATVGDVASLTYARWGFAGKPFEVASVSLTLDNGALVPDLGLTETSPLIYDWTASEAQIYAAAPRSNLPSAFDVGSPSPPVVTEALYVTLAGDGVKAKATLTWSATDADLIASYEVTGSYAGGAWADLGRPPGQLLEVLDVTPGLWTFRVRAVSALGVRSDWASSDVQIFGLAALPAPITGISMQSAGGLAVLKWDRHPDLDVRIGGAIVIRHSAVASPGWSSSVSMDRVQGGQAIAVVSLKPGTYLLAAEDSGGRLGPVATISTDGVGALTFSSVALLSDDTLFAGPRSGVGVLPSGGLVLTGTALISDVALVSALTSVAWLDGQVRLSGTYEFGVAMDLVTPQRIRLRSVINHVSLPIYDRISLRSGLVSSWQSVGGADGAETDVLMEATVTSDDPASGSAVWSGWQRVDAHELIGRGVKGRATLSTTDAAYTPLVTLLKLQAEVIL